MNHGLSEEGSASATNRPFVVAGIGAAFGRRVIPGRRVRYVVLALIDLACAVFAVAMALLLRMSGEVPAAMWQGLLASVPVIMAVSVVVFHAVGLYGRAWRYLSATDLPLIIVAATLAVAGWTLVLALLGLNAWMPLSVPVIAWMILLGGLGGVRLSRRLVLEYLREHPAANDVAVPAGLPRRALIVGAGDRIELALRLLAANPASGYVAVGILDDQAGHLSLRVRGVPVLGGIDALEQAVTALAAGSRRPDCVLLADDCERLAGARLVRFVNDAERLGLAVARLPVSCNPDAASAAKLDLTFIDIAALLGRPLRSADTPAIAGFVAGQRVMVTGAGGTIGRELVFQIAQAGPSEIVLVDAAEFNLYTIDQELGDAYPELPRFPVLCSIRQRGNVMNMFAKYRPNLVFHAAALKHVPLVETNPCAGVLTNVIGTRNIADAAKRFGARAMVQVSTDKAVNPVGVMGATKRLGELYCQALDLDGQACPVGTRFLTVRFGNVLGSSGSLIPLLQRQLSRRGPLTVTHPEIRRYFMTVHEAVLLILQGAAHALHNNAHHGRIFVLDMGEPIRIIDIARRMVRLAGLEPERDVKIDLIGLRPGEKLYEELFDASELRLEQTIPGIFEAEAAARPLAALNADFDRLAAAAQADDSVTVRMLLPQVVAGTAWRTDGLAVTGLRRAADLESVAA
jgi:O-antigen biosynthesis protein WbqV